MNQISKHFNINLEKSLLASLMSIDDSFLDICSTVSKQDFYATQHQVIFSAIANLSKNNQPYDALMVADYLKSTKELEQVGGENYLGDLLSQSPVSQFNLKFHAERIHELSELRQAEQALLLAKDILERPNMDSSEKINEIVENLTGIVNKKADEREAETVGSLMPEFFAQLQNYCKGIETPFLETGLIELDNKAPIQAGELIVIAGRPSMGKTTLGQTIMQNIVKQTKSTGVFFSLEMPKMQVMQRFVSSMTGIELSKIKSGKGLTTSDWEALYNATSLYHKEFPMFIDDRSQLTYQQMRSTLNKIRNQQGKIGLIMVDYIQIMGGIVSNDRVASIGNITSALKSFGKEYDCPVIALSQLNRGLESRTDKRPVMSDLRESGAIEQDADHVWLIYRDEVYKHDTKEKGIAEIIVAKQRQGAVGTVRLGFEGQYCRFINNIPFAEDDTGWMK